MFQPLINRIHRTDTPLLEDDGTGTAVSDSYVGVQTDPGARGGGQDAAVDAAGRVLAGAARLSPDQRDLIHLALDWVDAPLAFFDTQLTLLFVNDAYCRLVERTRESLLGRPIDAVASAEQRGRASEYGRRALTGESVDIDLAYRQDGSFDHVSRLQYRPQYDGSGALVGVLCVIHRMGRRQSDRAVDDDRDDADGTDLLSGGSFAMSAPIRAAFRVAQDEVAERERKQRELIESLPLPLVFIGNDGFCRWANTAFCTTFGVEERHVSGSAVDSLSGLSVANIRDGMALAADGRRHSVEERLVLRGSEPRWYRIDFLPGFDRTQVHNGVYALLSDIDDSRRAASRLEESEAHFRSFTDNVPETIVFLDREGRFRYANQSFVARTDRTREEIVGRSIGELFGSDVLDRSSDAMARAFAGESLTHEGRDPFGESQEWRETRYLPIRGVAGRVEGYQR